MSKTFEREDAGSTPALESGYAQKRVHSRTEEWALGKIKT